MSDFDDPVKTIATVRDVCRMVGLSPARFYGLMKAGVFPLPVYDILTHRPHFTEEQQRQCLDVRRRNCGVNGTPVCFYARRLNASPAIARPRTVRHSTTPRQKNDHAGLVEALRGLGLAAVTPPQVAEAVRTLYPCGAGQTPESEVIRAVFLHLKRQDRDDSVRR